MSVADEEARRPNAPSTTPQRLHHDPFMRVADEEARRPNAPSTTSQRLHHDPFMRVADEEARRRPNAPSTTSQRLHHDPFMSVADEEARRPNAPSTTPQRLHHNPFMRVLVEEARRRPNAPSTTSQRLHHDPFMSVADEEARRRLNAPSTTSQRLHHDPFMCVADEEARRPNAPSTTSQRLHHDPFMRVLVEEARHQPNAPSTTSQRLHYDSIMSVANEASRRQPDGPSTTLAVLNVHLKFGGEFDVCTPMSDKSESTSPPTEFVQAQLQNCSSERQGFEIPPLNLPESPGTSSEFEGTPEKQPFPYWVFEPKPKQRTFRVTEVDDQDTEELMRLTDDYMKRFLDVQLEEATSRHLTDVGVEPISRLTCSQDSPDINERCFVDNLGDTNPTSSHVEDDPTLSGALALDAGAPATSPEALARVIDHLMHYNHQLKTEMSRLESAVHDERVQHLEELKRFRENVNRNLQTSSCNLKGDLRPEGVGQEQESCSELSVRSEKTDCLECIYRRNSVSCQTSTEPCGTLQEVAPQRRVEEAARSQSIPEVKERAKSLLSIIPSGQAVDKSNLDDGSKLCTTDINSKDNILQLQEQTIAVLLQKLTDSEVSVKKSNEEIKKKLDKERQSHKEIQRVLEEKVFDCCDIIVETYAGDCGVLETPASVDVLADAGSSSTSSEQEVATSRTSKKKARGLKGFKGTSRVDYYAMKSCVKMMKKKIAFLTANQEQTNKRLDAKEIDLRASAAQQQLEASVEDVATPKLSQQSPRPAAKERHRRSSVGQRRVEASAETHKLSKQCENKLTSQSGSHDVHAAQNNTHYLQGRLSDVTKQLFTKAKEVRNLQCDVADLKKELQTLNTRFERSEASNNSKQKIIDNYKRKVQDLEKSELTATEQVTSLTNKIRVFKDEANEMKKKIASQGREISTMIEERVKYIERMGILKLKVADQFTEFTTKLLERDEELKMKENEERKAMEYRKGLEDFIRRLPTIRLVRRESAAAPPTTKTTPSEEGHALACSILNLTQGQLETMRQGSCPTGNAEQLSKLKEKFQLIVSEEEFSEKLCKFLIEYLNKILHLANINYVLES